MSWEEAYANGVPAVHANEQDECDAYIQEVAGHPELREIVVGERSVQVPVEHVSVQLQALGIDPTTEWY